MFRGCMVALVTPMLSSTEVDYTRLLKLVDWHIASGSDGLVILGTTGEAATVTAQERQRVVAEVIERVNGRVPVVVGTGTNSTAQTVALTEQAKAAGADGALLVTPYYNKPTQQGLIAHYRAVADAVDLPQMLYNVPSRSGCDLLPEAVLELASHPAIIGIKDASGDLSRVTALKGSGLDLFSGDDASALDFMLAGGHGVISVIANILPRVFGQLCRDALAGSVESAREVDRELQDTYRMLFVESNPIPVKWWLHRMGKTDDGLRLPLTPLSEEYHAPILSIIHRHQARYKI